MTEQIIPATDEGLSKIVLANRSFDAISLDAQRAHVLADLAAEVFDNLARDNAPDKNGFIVYRITQNQVDQIDFLLNEQVMRTRDLKNSISTTANTVKRIMEGGAA